MAAKKSTNKVYYYGTGRRKNAVAAVRLVPGSGKITINSKDIDEYFGLDTLKLLVRQVCLPYLRILYRYDDGAMAFQEVECQSVGDATEPGRERCLVGVIAVDVAEGAKKGVLCQFLGVLQVLYLSDDHGEDTLRIATEHGVLSLMPSLTDSLHDFLFCQISHFDQADFRLLLVIRQKQKNISQVGVKKS